MIYVPIKEMLNYNRNVVGKRAPICKKDNLDTLAAT